MSRTCSFMVGLLFLFVATAPSSWDSDQQSDYVLTVDLTASRVHKFDLELSVKELSRVGDNTHIKCCLRWLGLRPSWNLRFCPAEFYCHFLSQDGMHLTVPSEVVRIPAEFRSGSMAQWEFVLRLAAPAEVRQISVEFYGTELTTKPVPVPVRER